MSRPLRGAWIEINVNQLQDMAAAGRALCGARGLKSAYPVLAREREVVAPFAGRVD